jgi:stearoyl-CoA desaturase (delta-9 desaturase)
MSVTVPRHLATNVLFYLLHVAALLTLFLVTPTWEALAVGGVLYVVRMFAITAGYHRYLAHRSFRTTRLFQFILALVGCSAVQKGPLWWAKTHRLHHKHSDEEGDPHSPVVHGFFRAHIGWISAGDTPEMLDPPKDLAKYWELRLLDRFHAAPGVLLALLCWWLWGLPGLMWGFMVSTVVLYHATFTVNSVCHLWGSRPYDTKDGSRNNFLMALLTMGEGWHNNHHHEMTCARQGREWWQIDITYYVLRALALVGIVWDIKEPRKERIGHRKKELAPH